MVLRILGGAETMNTISEPSGVGHGNRMAVPL